MYKGVLFDFDNTLHDYFSSYDIAIKSTFEEIEKNFSIPLSEISDAYKHARSLLHAQILPVYDTSGEFVFIQKLLELLGLNVLTESINLYTLYEKVLLDNLLPMDFAEELLKTLKLNNKKICVITNSQVQIQIKKLQRLNMSQYIDCIVSSEETNVEKPHPYIFNSSLKKLDLYNHEVCMVGDNYEKDAVGALLCNIKPFWLNLNKANRKIENNVTVVYSLKELIKYLI